MPTEAPPTGDLTLHRPSDGSLLIRLAGTWRLEAGLPPTAAVERELSTDLPTRVVFDTEGLGAWDSGILTFLVAVSRLGREHGVVVDWAGLPEGLQRLVSLAEAVPEKEHARAEETEREFIERVGEMAIETHYEFWRDVEFVGQVAVALARALRGKARFRRSDLALLIQQNGFEALPIVTLVTFLLGLILAFVGAVQLQTFGATIYVADLVGVAMVRDMGALITGIVMAGRSGAAFAAQLGAMSVTQETDALTTMAISPIEFLVLPRLLALCLMMPFLTLYGDAMGILGGSFVGITMLDLSAVEYFQQTANAISLTDVLGGVFKGSVYGVLIAIAGCLRGMNAGKSSSAVGDAATSAVVTSIVAIIVACGLFAFLFYTLGI
ncbi:MAG: ABC transporter permease [Gemmatimonadetes bacterium]|nr:ABC transporter permease [Gemmatimonadota bacterium]